MAISQDVTAAKQTADAALHSIDTNALAPSPQNFAIWYAYHAGRHPDLNHAIDRLADGDEAMTEGVMGELHRRFFDQTAAAGAVAAAGDRMANTVQEVTALIGRAGDDTSRYGDTLAGITGALSAEASDADVRDAVATLAAETQAMQDQNKVFQQRLAESNQEIDELRHSLEAVRQEAMTDSLTGLVNRRYLDDALIDTAKQCNVQNQSMALLVLDIDHFKRFNDTYGHQLGDVVLKQVARCLTANTKGRDIAGRFGGEEFVIILPDTDLDGAMAVAEQIRANVAGKQIILKSSGKSLGQITLSIGAATMNKDEDVAETLHRADEALYAAKDAGRNRVLSENQLPAGKKAIA